jgi:lipid-binding SYLF domain-containing protein
MLAKTHRQQANVHCATRRRLAALVVALPFAIVASRASAQAEQRNLVADATITLANFINDPDMTWLKQNFKRAKAVLIAPQIAKAGLIIGGSGGHAVVVAHEVVTLVMTEKGFDSLLSDSVKLGGDAAVAAGPIGAGAQANLTADFVSFARSTGVYGGLNFDGTVITTADEWNQAYYGQRVHAPDILVRTAVRNKQAGELINLVTRAASS